MFSLGQLQLKSNLFLSPLAGYTNLPFRLVIREIGGVDLCTTDLVNARSLIEQNPKALKLIETNDQDSPLSVQLFGGVKEEMRDASILLQEHGVDSIDVNMGCPVPKVTKTGGGASMMNELPKTQELIRAMVEAVDVPKRFGGYPVQKKLNTTRLHGLVSLPSFDSRLPRGPMPLLIRRPHHTNRRHADLNWSLYHIAVVSRRRDRLVGRMCHTSPLTIPLRYSG